MSGFLLSTHRAKLLVSFGVKGIKYFAQGKGEGFHFADMPLFYRVYLFVYLLLRSVG